MRDEDNRGLSFHSPELSPIFFVWPGQFVEMTRLRIEVYACLHGSLEIDVAVCATILTTSLSRGSAWCLHKAGRQWKGSHLCLDLGCAFGPVI